MAALNIKALLESASIDDFKEQKILYQTVHVLYSVGFPNDKITTYSFEMILLYIHALLQLLQLLHRIQSLDWDGSAAYDTDTPLQLTGLQVLQTISPIID